MLTNDCSLTYSVCIHKSTHTYVRTCMHLWTSLGTESMFILGAYRICECVCVFQRAFQTKFVVINIMKPPYWAILYSFTRRMLDTIVCMCVCVWLYVKKGHNLYARLLIIAFIFRHVFYITRSDYACSTTKIEVCIVHKVCTLYKQCLLAFFCIEVLHSNA